MAKKKNNATSESKPAEKPMSLRPLGFEEAVQGLLATPPKKNGPSGGKGRGKEFGGGTQKRRKAG